MARVGAFLKLTRPHFLLGGLLMFALGAATVGAINWSRYFIAQSMVTAAQVTAHYINEYFDVAADRIVEHRTLFSGGSGVLASGELGPHIALRAGVTTSLFTAGAAIVVATWTWNAALLGMVALAVSWVYSAPPVRLLGTGWGEAATSLVVTVIVPVIGAWALGGSITPYLAWAIALLLPIHIAMMLAFELPDLATDTAAGKTVLAVRVGRRATLRLAVALYVASLGAAVGGAVFSEEVSSFVVAWTVALVPIAATLLAARGRRYALMTTSAVLALASPAAVLLMAAPTVSGG